jgi:tRNA(Arg) A34 adenosine deaminase TadA
MRTYDVEFLRRAIQLAQTARENGNHPFGAVLVDKNGDLLLEAMNSVVTSQDITGHAETNLVREASRVYPPEFLAECTLYSSAEPCPMCAGAIFWSSIRRVVYALGEEQLYRHIHPDSEDVLLIPCRDILMKGARKIDIHGPLLEEEAILVHKDFWK